MQLRLVNQLAAVLAATVLLTTVALGALAAWNLRSGFSDYLRAQDELWLQRFTELAAQAVQREGLAAISGPPGVLRPLIDGLRSETGLGPAGPPRDGREPREPRDPRELRDPREGRPPRPDGDPRRHGPRLTLTAPDGRVLTGRPDFERSRVLQRNVVVQGRVVATAWLREGPPVADTVDTAFLARQYLGLVAAAVAALVLAIVAAVLLARRWVQPLVQAQAAARRIAQGEFDVRIAASGAGSVELRALADDINAMADSLARLEGSRRRWMAELSHELRTPLAVLRAELEALQDGLRQPDATALRSLHEEVQRLARLADDFHQLALSELRALPLRREPVDALALVRRVAERMREVAATQGLQLELVQAPVPPQALPPSAAPSPSPTASWDADRITQVLTNMLHNSLRYTDAPGRVQLTVRHLATQATIELTLEDSAPGVPAAEFPRLFEPLFRAEASRTRAQGGSGLGLAICRAIVEGHGGRISAAPSALGGLRVDVYLPLQGGERA